MKKKQYIAPECTVIKSLASQLLSGSGSVGYNYGETYNENGDVGEDDGQRDTEAKRNSWQEVNPWNTWDD